MGNYKSMWPVSSGCRKLLLIALIFQSCCICCSFQRPFRGYIMSKVQPLNKCTCYISMGNGWLCKKKQQNTLNCGITVTGRDLKSLCATSKQGRKGTVDLFKNQHTSYSHWNNREITNKTRVTHRDSQVEVWAKKKKKVPKNAFVRCFLLLRNKKYYSWESYVHGLNFWGD